MSEENLYKRGETWWLRATIDGREYRESLRTRDVKTARGRRDNRLKELTTAIYRLKKREMEGNNHRLVARHCP